MSYTSEFIVQLIQDVIESDGIDISGLYCLHTGRLMGSFDLDEVLFAANQVSDCDRESLIDDMMVRVVGSMRPSIAWNRPDRLMLADMARMRPIDCMAFLVNRICGDRHTILKRGDHSFQPLLDRIWTHKKFTNLAAHGFDVTPWIHWLLELDAKMNLHDIAVPRYILTPTNQWKLSHQDGISIFGLVDCENADEMLKVFETWVFEKLEEYDKRDALLLRESTWVRGNSFAKTGFIESWRAHPEIANKRLQAEFDAKQRAQSAKPKPLTRLRPQSKTDAMLAQFGSQLDALFAVGAIEAQNSIATPKPEPTRKLIIGGLKLARKDS